MLFRQDTLEAIVRGEVDLAFRRWGSPRVRIGTRLHTAVGVIEVTDVAEVRADGIGDRDAARAGFPSVAPLLEMLGQAPRGGIYRVAVRYAGADPRIALREAADLSNEERVTLLAALGPVSAKSIWDTSHLLCPLPFALSTSKDPASSADVRRAAS